MNKPEKTPEVPMFETVEQIMADAYLLERIVNTINEMIVERDKVSEGGKIKLKRDAVSFLIEMNKFNAEFISAEYIEMHYKRSKLSSAIREFISYLIIECVNDTFKHYEALYQKQNKKKAGKKANS